MRNFLADKRDQVLAVFDRIGQRIKATNQEVIDADMIIVEHGIGDLVGWFGGALVSKYTGIISIEPEAYFSVLRRYTYFHDVMKTSVVKVLFTIL